MGSSRSKYILAAVVILAIAFFWSKHRNATDSAPVAESEEAAPAETNATGAPTEATGAAAIGTAAATPTPAPSATPSGGTEASFKAALQQCWGSFQTGQMSDSGDVTGFLHAVEQEDAALAQTIFENYHISTNEGERRVQVLFQDNQPSQLRFFGVDDEDLPVPVPAEDSNKRPIEQALQDFLRKGNQTFHQVRRELNLRNGLTAEIETVNDNPTEIQLHGLPGGTFVCAKENCRCISYTAPTDDDPLMNPPLPPESGDGDDSP